MRGGVGVVSRARFPPGPYLRGSRFSRLPTRRKWWQRPSLAAVSWAPSPPRGPGPKALEAPAPRPWGPAQAGTRPRARDPVTLLDFLSCTIDFLSPGHQARRRTACVLVLTRSGKAGFLHRLICFKSHKYYPLARARFWCGSSSSQL